MDTYSRKPFITHDKIDENGVRAEVKVITGFGVPEKINPSDKGKSQNVSFRVENTKYLPAGWAPIDDPVMAIVKAASESGEAIHFRIEQRRKDNVDRTKTIDELAPKGNMAAARDNTFRSLAAVKRADDENWTTSPYMKTRFEEDPVDASHVDPYAMDLESFTGGKVTSPSAARPAANNNGFEPAPYITRNNDGTINVGSIAVSVPLNLYSFVLDYERSNPELGELSDTARTTLAKVLLHASNEIQLGIYEGKMEKPDMSAGSHTRARALVFEVIRTFYPLTKDVMKDKDSLVEWKELIVKKSLAMWKWSISEVEKILS